MERLLRAILMECGVSQRFMDVVNAVWEWVLAHQTSLSLTVGYFFCVVLLGTENKCQNNVNTATQKQTA